MAVFTLKKIKLIRNISLGKTSGKGLRLLPPNGRRRFVCAQHSGLVKQTLLFIRQEKKRIFPADEVEIGFPSSITSKECFIVLLLLNVKNA